jgi:thiol:disulfide interchange protein DsbD
MKTTGYLGAARIAMRAAMLPALLATLLAALGLGAAPAFAAADDPLKPDQAFRYSVAAEGNDIVVRWDILPGYYLYQERMSFEARTPGLTLGAPRFPEGEPHEDEFFGLMHIYRGATAVPIPVVAAPPGGGPVEIAIKSQGCADIGLCYPPQTWVARVDLPAATSAARGPGLDALLSGTGGARGFEQPLPVEQAFRHRAELVDPFTVAVTFTIEPGYYLYRHTLGLKSSGAGVEAGTPQLPPGTPFNDEEYGDTLVFYDEVTMTVPLTRARPEAITAPFTLAFQGCKTDSICYPPQAVVLQLELPLATGSGASGSPAGEVVSEQDQLFTLIRDGNIGLVMLMFAGLGLLLSFTPCCLPMYPILSGIIVGQGNGSAGRSFLLSVAYVLGMALTYTALGAIVAAAGAQVQAVFQQPWVIVGVALLFVALALSMFGLYELQMPASIQTRLATLSGQQRSGSFVGAGIMGMISAAVVTTCVTPPLVAALTVIARTGDVTRGSLALFALAFGMGIPLLVLGASAGKLLPKAGAWMVSVKTVFGLLMLAMAVWMLDRLWPGTLTLALWAVLLVVGGVFLGAFAPVDGGAPTGRKLGKAFGIVALIYGCALLVGALAGNENPLRPLQFVAMSGSGPGATATEAPLFTRIKSVADFDRELTRAGAEGRPLMLDFYADWCASCKEMEEYTFPHPAVRAELARAITLQADVTAVDADDQALMARFGIVGPPTIVFFTPDGTEQANRRVVGFKPAEQFATHVRDAFAAGGPGKTTALAEAR